ncbi:hypothetical protein [Marivivens marinus]|uniref:hypothetical protein n=1 Tax=Marivivens marinus TaxID=3110173 RepID=UPI003B845A30
MNPVRQKIKDTFDQLEVVMKEQKHLDIQNGLFKEVLPLVAKASKYWRVLDDEHRDYLNCIRDTISAGKRWE